MSLTVNLTQYKINMLDSEGNTLTYRAYEHIPYVSGVVAQEYLCAGSERKGRA